MKTSSRLLTFKYEHVLENWGLDVPIEEQIDDLEDDEEIELPQSVQLEPPKEYVLIMSKAFQMGSKWLPI